MSIVVGLQYAAWYRTIQWVQEIFILNIILGVKVLEIA